MNNEELQRKLKVERIEICLNCILFIDCKQIGKLEECEEFVEVDSEKTMVIVRLAEYARSESS